MDSKARFTTVESSIAMNAPTPVTAAMPQVRPAMGGLEVLLVFMVVRTTHCFWCLMPGVQ